MTERTLHKHALYGTGHEGVAVSPRNFRYSEWKGPICVIIAKNTEHFVSFCRSYGLQPNDGRVRLALHERVFAPLNPDMTFVVFLEGWNSELNMDKQLSILETVGKFLAKRTRLIEDILEERW